MFPDLPAFEADEAFLRTLGGAGGVCDCSDAEDDPASLADVAAGWPIFGQFVAHDITADRSPLEHHVDSHTLQNARGPQLNLECLYGDGPVGHPFLYQREDPAKLLLGPGGLDVPRNAEGTALVGDPRNDSHMLMTQLHVAMIKAHNLFVDDARRRGVADQDVFRTAAREMVWHYQSIIVDEFLPSLVGASLVDEIRTSGPRWFRPDRALFIPLEFADGAYRYGHCQIRHRYRLNRTTEPVAVFPDLLGFQPVPREHVIDWTLFFDAPDRPPAQRAKKIDGRLVASLIRLPVAVTGQVEVEEYHSLAVRDLQRGQGVGLPSGEAVARLIGATPLTSEEVGLRASGWARETPLWYYVLREAVVQAGGQRLGEVGGRIVAEVILTILDRDPESVTSDSEWRSRASLIDLLLERPPA
jgi:hypothetical protein